MAPTVGYGLVYIKQIRGGHAEQYYETRQTQLAPQWGKDSLPVQQPGRRLYMNMHLILVSHEAVYQATCT